jgi:DNA-binding response OmpR family regulator
MRVLVADDSMVSLALIRSLVTAWGYVVVAVTNGDDAWAALQATDAPDIAILDWEMPGITGPEICRKLRNVGGRRDTYVILLTGREDKKEIVAAFDAGADDYVTKPFHHEELRARVRAGARMIELRTQLVEQNRSLELARAELRRLRQGDPGSQPPPA